MNKIKRAVAERENEIVEMIEKIRKEKYWINTANKKGYENLGANKAIDNILSLLTKEK